MKRSEFFKKSIVVSLGMGSLPSLAAVDALTQTKPTGIKITDVKPYVFKKAAFVKVETDAGISGWGEGDHDHPALVGEVISILKKEIIGKDPFQSEYLWYQMYYKGEDIGTSGLMPGTIAGIDNALWDLKGKALNVPVHRLLGGANREKIPVYGSFARGEGKNVKSTEEMAAIAAGLVEQGYKAVKARMQIRQLNIDPYPDPTYDIIKAVRKSIGDNIELFVDFNNGYTPSRAIMIGKKLYEHFNIAAIEEPVTYQNYSDLAQVVEALDIPIMAGEHEFNKWQMRDLITIGKVDIINPDVIKAGGITECWKMAAMAQAFDKYVRVHNARPSLKTAASLQFISSIHNAAHFQEYAGPRTDLGLSDLFLNDIQYADGFLAVPQLPGIGLLPDEKMMEKNKLNK